ncbi:MAG: hypothetical protein U1E76_28485 [Planctomycetota bacterium]
MIAADQLDDGNLGGAPPGEPGVRQEQWGGAASIEAVASHVGQEKVTDVELRVPLDEPVLVQGSSVGSMPSLPRRGRYLERVHRMETCS